MNKRLHSSRKSSSDVNGWISPDKILIEKTDELPRIAPTEEKKIMTQIVIFINFFI
jgi:hypothetical protein